MQLTGTILSSTIIAYPAMKPGTGSLNLNLNNPTT